MTAQAFFDKWNGIYLDNDGAYGNQCVDVIKQYFIEVLGIPAIRNNAIDYWNNYPSSYLTRIPNTPSFVPIKGDIMVWGKGVGEYGHIGIVNEANVNTFVSFDENWPSGSICHFQNHNYGSVLGVLRPVKDVNFDQEAFNKEQTRIAEENRVKAELAKKIADDAQKAEAKRVADEQKKLAEEQAKLEAELKARIEAETKIEIKEETKVESEKYELNLTDFIKAAKGSLYTFFGVFGLLIVGFAQDLANGTPDYAGLLFAVAAAFLSAVGNLFIRFFKDK